MAFRQPSPLRVLFVASGNSAHFDIIPFIKEQGRALEQSGVEVSYFGVQGKGLWGYLRSVGPLRRLLKTGKFDLIHGHFILSGLVAILANLGSRPVVVSLMGSDAYGEYIGAGRVSFASRYLTLLTWITQPFFTAIISKSSNIERFVYLKKKSFVIPNGIDLEKFRPDVKSASAIDDLKEATNILFLGSAKNKRKNIELVKQAIHRLGNMNIRLVNPYPVGHHEIPGLLNRFPVLAVCSFMEGSPNLVKEAMACNCPIVTTDVGDVRWVIGETDGCFVADFTADDFARKLESAILYSQKRGRTRGRDQIMALGLGAQDVSQRVIEVYKFALKKHENPN